MIIITDSQLKKKKKNTPTKKKKNKQTNKEVKSHLIIRYRFINLKHSNSSDKNKRGVSCSSLLFSQSVSLSHIVTLFSLCLVRIFTFTEREREREREMSNKQAKEAEDPMGKATIAVEDLYHIQDTYFPTNPDDKISKLQKESDLALNLLDSVPQGAIFLYFPAHPFRFLAYCLCYNMFPVLYPVW